MIEIEIDPRGCYVYLLWGADPDQPLYVGRSSRNVCARIGNQLREPGLGPLIERVTLVRCDSHDDTLSTELRLIHEHRPPWNVVGVPADRPEVVSYP